MHKLWYKSPALAWKSALPIGNGITGVMVYGGKRTETLWFNNASLWSGYPKNQDNPKSLENLAKVRELILAGKNHEAQLLAESTMNGNYSEAYLPLGKLKISVSGAGPGKYKRELDIKQAVHTVCSGKVLRTAFVSYPDNVAVYRIECGYKFSISVSGSCPMPHTVEAKGNGFELAGQAPDYAAPNYLRSERHPIQYDKGLGMGFGLRAEAVTDGKIICRGKKLIIKNAKVVTLYMVTETGFKGYDKMPETRPECSLLRCRAALKTLNKDYNAILARHTSDYGSLYNRQSVDLHADSNLPTDELLKRAKEGVVDNALANLFYNYGKYLMISGSRKGGQALNLQGIWNKSMRPPWSSNYTVNINTEMNYWGMAECGLTDCAEPFVNLVYEIMENGRSTARTNFGCEGFCCNHNADIWRKTSPVKGGCEYMLAPLCGMWLINELAEHYRSGDMQEYKDKLERILSEAVRFVNSFLVMHDGHYVICPSSSPESAFIKDGKRSSLTYSSAFDTAVIKQLYKNYRDIGADKALIEEINTKEPLLYPFTDGADGINEWNGYDENAEKGHRHFSPLYAIYPGRVIGYYGDPIRREWSRKLFHTRLENSKHVIGWSAAWAICLAARFREPERVKYAIDNMLGKSVFKNLFDVHPPFLFQIDGNLGFVAGINEMLVTVEDGTIELLPACPKEFTSGEVKNMRTAAGLIISFSWENGMVISLSVKGGKARIRNLHLSPDLKAEEIEIM